MEGSEVLFFCIVEPVGDPFGTVTAFHEDGGLGMAFAHEAHKLGSIGGVASGQELRFGDVGGEQTDAADEAWHHGFHGFQVGEWESGRRNHDRVCNDKARGVSVQGATDGFDDGSAADHSDFHGGRHEVFHDHVDLCLHLFWRQGVAVGDPQRVLNGDGGDDGLTVAPQTVESVQVCHNAGSA